MTLSEFLLARIAEDEAAVNERTRRMAPPGHELLEQFGDFGDDERWMIEIGAHRVLAECEAKRQIVAEHPAEWNDAWRVLHCPTCSDSSDTTWSEPTWPCNTLRALASVYADHPDYRQEWWVEIRRLGDMEPTYVKGACNHLEVVPVEATFTASEVGEPVVAHLCLTCDQQLPAEWRDTPPTTPGS